MGADPDVYIRDAVASDLQQIALLERQLFSVPWSLAQLQNGLRVNYWIWVAMQQDRLAGYLVASHGGGVADLLTLGVAGFYQRRGLGQQLLHRLFEQLARDQADALFLEVRESNAAAVALYRKCGFEPVAIRKGYYRDGVEPEDAIVMRNSDFLTP